MFLKLFIIATVFAGVVLCEPPVAPVYGVPFNNNNNNQNNGGYNGYNGGGYNGYNDGGYNGVSDGSGGHGVNENNGPVNGHDDNDHHGYGEPKAYEFGYQVKDDHTGTDYNRQEQSDGNQVTGSYRVALPDGRVQIVTYYADWKTGFHADVRYEGEAQYPEVYNTNNNYPNNQYGTPNNNNNNNYHGNQYDAQTGSNNGYHGNVNNQYGAPVNPVSINNQYAGDYSSGSGQDFSGTSGSGYSASGYDYDSYSGGYGNKNQQPGTAYGAP